MKKISVVLLVVIILAIGGFIVRSQLTANKSAHDQLVYIRAIEPKIGEYYATLDSAEESDTANDTNSDTKEFVSLERLAVSPLSPVMIVDHPDVTTVSQLVKLLTAEPAYTNHLFTVTVKDTMIVSIREEKL